MGRSGQSQALMRTLLYMCLFFPFVFVLYFIMGAAVFREEYQSLAALLSHSGFLAIMVSLGMGIPSFFAFRNLYNPDYSRSSGVDRSAYGDVQLPYRQAFDRCLISLGQLGKPVILLEDRQNGRIEATIQPRRWWEYLWKSWGQRVSFRLGSDQEDHTTILVTSRSPLTTTVIDFGAHRRTVERVTAFLQERAGSQRVT